MFHPSEASDASLDPERAIEAIIRSYGRGIIQLYSRIRFSILRQPFLEEIGQYLPKSGRVLDLGSGFGLFSLFFASTAHARSLVGVERDRARVQCAWESAKMLALSNVRYECSDVRDWSATETFDAIYMLDLVHHLPAAEVPGFLAKARDRLEPGGVLLVKDVADRPTYKRLFTLFLDRLMTNRDPIRYWPPEELTRLLESLDFDVVRHQMKDFLPFPHVLFICRDRRARGS